MCFTTLGAGVARTPYARHMLITSIRVRKVIAMKLFGFIASLAIVASPALANYGDADTQLDILTPEIVVVSQPLMTPSHVVATAATCPLPSDHMVSVPATFTDADHIEMACLVE